MKFFTSVILLLFLIHPSFSQETEIIYLSGQDSKSTVDWEFKVSKGSQANIWTTIPVPSNWELQGFGAYNYGHDDNKSNEIGFYKYHFNVSKRHSNKKITIVFEGSMTDTEVKINGKLAGDVHQGGFYRFEYDITNLVNYDNNNLLEVTVNKVSANKSIEIAERKSDYWVFGGIYRPVYLKIEPQKHIIRTAINAKSDGFFSVDIYFDTKGEEALVEAQIIQQNGKKLGGLFSGNIDEDSNHITLKITIAGQKNWTAESPTLYFINIKLKQKKQTIHSIRERFGFRTIEVRKGKGIFLNEKRIALKGVNRHSFWPSTGRALNRDNCLMDIKLMKEMNMNAVRMSHYPPDTYFLDLCDEYGLYVLDELAGWQKPSYDTETGIRLVEQMVIRDVNHPSILFWDNGNEGGWNREIDDEFAKYDPQKRNVLHPWELFGDIDTDHYEGYESVKKKLNGDNIFMPTEHLHGLYDGGLGAGLDDYWKLMWGNPLNGGMFLWDLIDEGVVRFDKNGMIDVDGNHAGDGILGPYREKEASFYTIKEIWSPVYIETNDKINPMIDGEIVVENRYDFTNLDECTFKWQMVKYADIADKFPGKIELANGSVKGPNISSGNKGVLNLNLPKVNNADALVLTGYDKYQEEIYTWKWKLNDNLHFVNSKIKLSGKTPQLKELDTLITLSTEDFDFNFNSKTGLLLNVTNRGHAIPFNTKSLFVSNQITNNNSQQNVNLIVGKSKSRRSIEVKNHPEFKMLKWTVSGNGWLKLDYEYVVQDSLDYYGVSFNYPENRMHGMKWLGKGPYRVWGNRLKGQTIDVWENTYNNFAAGSRWDYPEFTGYYANFSWVVFDTQDGSISVVAENDELYLRMYSQIEAIKPRGTKMIWPDGDISFLHKIPAIGTKFQKADSLKPIDKGMSVEVSNSATIYFYFGMIE